SLNEYKENPYNHLENIKWEDRNIISDEDFKNMDYGKLVSDLYYYKLRNFGTWNPNYNDDELLKHLIDTDNNFYKKSGVETKEQKPILPQNDNIIKFIPGKIYYGIHIGDSDLKSYYRVISRTNKQVTVIALDGNGNDYKEPFKRGIEIYSNIERFYPNGKYSMALSISADRESERIYEYKKNALDELGLKEVGEAKTIDELWIEHHNKDINTYIKKPKLELVQEIDNEEPGFFSKAEIDRKYINKEHKPTYKLLPEDKKNIQILIANIKNILLRNGLANKANEFIKEVYSGNKEISTVLFIAKKYLNIKF
ncbi:MAG: hypothetical protein KDK36_04835, partial [Leptospiraceae bacterium]|nr:hypothetical protein [Leptospiraceae bacterium]